MRRTLLAATAALLFTSVSGAFEHRGGQRGLQGGRVNPHSWHAPGWGIGPGGWGYSVGSPGSRVSGFVRFGSGLPFSGYGFSGFGSFGLGGLNYYYGPVGGHPFFDGYGYSPGYIQPPPAASYLPMAPIVIQAQPYLLGPNPLDNPVIREWLPDQQRRRRDAEETEARDAQPPQENVPVFLKESSPERRRQSQRYVVQGDDLFARQNYLQAIARYKQAISSAPDLALPRFRAAFALAAYGEFGQAVEHLKRGLALDPDWPLEGERLSDRMGENNTIALNHLLQRATGWAKEDVRDPDRLFLLGVLLYFNEDVEKSRLLFETALALSGRAPHVEAFLNARQRARERPNQRRDATDDNLPLPPPPIRDEPSAEEAPRQKPGDGRAGPPAQGQARLSPPAVKGPRLLPPDAPPTETVRNDR
jgi:hypothetical protein